MAHAFRALGSLVSLAMLLGACSASTPSSSPASASPSSNASPTASATPIDGTYQTTFTKADLVASPLLIDAEEINDENWGEWTLTFQSGRVAYTQRNDISSSESSGTFTVDGDTVKLAFDEGANADETFAFRWTLDGDTLTFTRDDSLGVGPTPYLVKPWTRVQ